eukprot:12929817-Prorocentrum_lima.AAC.1
MGKGRRARRAIRARRAKGQRHVLVREYEGTVASLFGKGTATALATQGNGVGKGTATGVDEGMATAG